VETPPGLELANGDVVLEGVNTKFIEFVSHAGMMHAILFGHPLVVTSGRDNHPPYDVHMQGRAVDVRTVDKDSEGVMLFLMILAYATTAQPIAVFDERNVPTGPHIHIEWHGA
jgi:hypothetical protein